MLVIQGCQNHVRWEGPKDAIEEGGVLGEGGGRERGARGAPRRGAGC